jgi:hypothetical protein
MNFTPSISLDSIVTLAGFAGAIFAQHLLMKSDIKQNKKDIDDLRRGRGLILGTNSDWPDAVRRCFGFGQKRD